MLSLSAWTAYNFTLQRVRLRLVRFLRAKAGITMPHIVSCFGDDGKSDARRQTHRCGNVEPKKSRDFSPSSPYTGTLSGYEYALAAFRPRSTSTSHVLPSARFARPIHAMSVSLFSKLVCCLRRYFDPSIISVFKYALLSTRNNDRHIRIVAFEALPLHSRV